MTLLDQSLPGETAPVTTTRSDPALVPTAISAPGSWRRWWPLAVIVLGTIALALPMVWGGVRLGQDTATQFYPWYANLGERLRAGGVPEWNPHQFGGAPLAADPQSGWAYLPAMLLFTLLPLPAAVVAQIAGHLLLANLGMWLLARRLGLGPLGALVAGFALAGSGIVYGRIPSGPASYQVVAWLPWVLLGAEVALGARTWPVRIAGWGLTGLAVSQALAAWVGQVSYYTLLLLGAWLVFRVLWGGTGRHVPAGGRSNAVLTPVGSAASAPRWPPAVSWPTLGRLAVHGTAVLAIGLGLSAAGLLPRLEFNGVSNASGGEYATDVGAVIGGSSSGTVIGRLFQPSLYYPGAAVLALAVIGLLLARGRFGGPFWLLVALGTIVLTIPAETPLHWLLYLLPRFRALHEHWPERVILIAFPGLALLAGAGAQALAEDGRTTGNATLRGVAVLLPGVILAGFGLLGGGVSVVAIVAVVSVAVITAVLLFRDRFPARASARDASGGGRDQLSRWLPATLLVVVVADLMLMTQALAGQAPFGGFHRRNLDAYYAPSGAAAFLRDRYETDEPFRFAGYDPAVGVFENGQSVLYRYQFPDPITRELAVNNRATVLGLEDVQGYDPLQIQRYVDLVTAMNGAPQEYHGSDLYPGGPGSPLLGLLNVRYLIVPSAFGADRTDLAGLMATWATVYDDGTVRVIENPGVLPRLWAVSETRTVPEGEALPLLADGGVDPLTTALLEEGIGPSPPVLPRTVAGTAAPALTLRQTGDPDTVRFDATVATDTLVVLSEVAYPGWVADVDGEPTDLLTADHALRAVVVPAGEHVVTLRYDSPATRNGLFISGSTLLVVVVGWLIAVWRSRVSGSAVLQSPPPAKRDPLHPSSRRAATPSLRAEDEMGRGRASLGVGTARPQATTRSDPRTAATIQAASTGCISGCHLGNDQANRPLAISAETP